MSTSLAGLRLRKLASLRSLITTQKEEKIPNICILPRFVYIFVLWVSHRLLKQLHTCLDFWMHFLQISLFNEKKSSSINLPSAPTWPCKAWTVHSFIQASLEELRVLVSQFFGRKNLPPEPPKSWRKGRQTHVFFGLRRDNNFWEQWWWSAQREHQESGGYHVFFFGPKRHSKSRAISTDNIPMITGQFPKVTPQLKGPNIVGLGSWWASQGHPVSTGYIIVLVVHNMIW